MPPANAGAPIAVERAVLDASVLLGGQRRYLVAAAALSYYTAFWSTWIAGELVRKRTEWVAERAAREECDLAQTRRRLRDSRRRVNAFVNELAGVLRTVDYAEAPPADLSWLADRDDWPVMQTALAAGADTLVTDNSTDFPLGQVRHGVLLLGAEGFLAALFRKWPDAERAVREYLQEAPPAGA